METKNKKDLNSENKSRKPGRPSISSPKSGAGMQGALAKENIITDIGDVDDNILEQSIAEMGLSSEKVDRDFFIIDRNKINDEESDDVLFEIHGMKIRNNCCYQITGKLDLNAPEALVQNESSKMLTPGVADYMSLPFDTVSNVFDTGFYESSPCYRRVSKDFVAKELKRRIKNVKDPYERLHGPGTLSNDPDNYDNLDNMRIPVYNRQMYYSSNEDHRLYLYFLLLGSKVCPKEMESDPKFMNTLYCIEDKNLVMDVSKKRAEQRLIANSYFGNMIQSDIRRAIYLLAYFGIVVQTKIDRNDIILPFTAWINDQKHPENAELFIKAYERTNYSDFYEVLQIHYTLSRLLLEGKLKLTEFGYSLFDKNIGMNLKEAALNVRNNPDLGMIRGYCFKHSKIDM